jgi:hypothetical protein
MPAATHPIGPPNIAVPEIRMAEASALETTPGEPELIAAEAAGLVACRTVRDAAFSRLATMKPAAAIPTTWARFAPTAKAVAAAALMRAAAVPITMLAARLRLRDRGQHQQSQRHCSLLGRRPASRHAPFNAPLHEPISRYGRQGSVKKAAVSWQPRQGLPNGARTQSAIPTCQVANTLGGGN